MPADIPVTTPVEPMPAIAGAPALQVPPDAALLSVVVTPAQMVIVPVIAGGNAITETINVALHPVTEAV